MTGDALGRWLDRRYLRHVLARWLIHAGLRVMPPGRARSEMSQLLWVYGLRIQAAVAAMEVVDG